MDRRELFEMMKYVDIHHATIDEAISTLEELKKECKNDEEYSKYYNLKLLLGVDGEDYMRLQLYGYRIESDKEFETRKEMLELSLKKYEKKQLKKDREEYARLTEKYPDGIPK